MRVSYVIIFVSDMTRSVEFYRDVVGLPLKFQSPEWTEFATEGATIALHASDSKEPGPASDRHGAPGHCRPGWTVTDLDAFHQRLIAQGVECIQEPTETFGVRIALYVDPDGLAFGVSGA